MRGRNRFLVGFVLFVYFLAFLASWRFDPLHSRAGCDLLTVLPGAIRRAPAGFFSRPRRLSIMKRRLLLTVVALSFLAADSCAENKAAPADAKTVTVVMETSKGTIKIE